MRSNGTHPRQVAARGYSPTWSPDGSRLAVPGENFNFVAAGSRDACATRGRRPAASPHPLAVLPVDVSYAADHVEGL